VKSRKFVSILMILVLASLACSLGAPASGAESNATAYPNPGGEYKIPEVTYPAPGTSDQPVQQSVLYPSAQDGAEVPWNQAVAMMSNGEVAKVVVGENLQVTLDLVDERSLVAFQPSEGALQEFLTQCGAVCQSIEVE
jgi:hypothetical protein